MTQQKPLSETTAADILASEQFENNVKDYLDRLKAERHKGIQQLERTGRKARQTLFDILENEGLMQPDKFIALFMQILSKRLKGFSARERLFIHSIGMECYRQTMLQMKANEKKQTENAPN